MKKPLSQKESKPDRIFNVTAENELMKFLIELFPTKSRNNIKSLLAHEQVFVNGKVVRKFDFPLKPGDNIKIGAIREAVATTKSFRGFTIIFEDEHLIVIDKHAGVLSIATKDEREMTAYSYLSKHVKFANPANKIFIVHRLDRDTSGLMVFAKTMEVQHLFQERWKEMITVRKYIAIVEGVVKEEEGVIKSYLHENKNFVVYSDQNESEGKLAITNFRRLKTGKGFSMLEVHLDTGRKNQIRVHMQEIGHPIVQDKKYGSTQNPIGRLGLHAQELGFKHPVTGKLHNFRTALPRKFSGLF